MATQPELAPAPARESDVDPVTVEVIRGAMETIAYEMATHVSLTATTPILNQSNERNATILDGARRARGALGRHPAVHARRRRCRCASRSSSSRDEGLYDGDVLVANDPYHGGGHLPDYNVFAPVFHDGELVLIASIQCHHADTGGGMPGGYNVDAPDIWAEGVRFPAVKLYDRGVERRDVTYFMKVNNRTPTFLGDLRAQVGAAQLGVRRLGEIVARYGVEAFAPPAGTRSSTPSGASAKRSRRGPTASTSRTSTSTTIRTATRTSTSTARSPSPAIGSPSTSPAPTRARTSRPTRRSATRAATWSRSSPR